MANAGADLIDIGGESTRPGSDAVLPEEQIKQVVPVLRELSHLHLPVLYSVDTTIAEVADAALDAGTGIINDISAGRNDEPAMFQLAARGMPADSHAHARQAQDDAAVADIFRCGR